MPSPSLIERDSHQPIDLAAIRAANEQRRRLKDAATQSVRPTKFKTEPTDDGESFITYWRQIGELRGDVVVERTALGSLPSADAEYYVAMRNAAAEDVVDALCAEVEHLEAVRQNLLAERNVEALAAMKWKEETGQLMKEVEQLRGDHRDLSQLIADMGGRLARTVAALQSIATHSVCCDARHEAAKALEGVPS